MPERTANPGSSSERGWSQAAGVVSASFASLATLIAAISCCLPVLSLTLAAGFAGLGAVLWSSRPYLLAAAVLFIA